MKNFLDFLELAKADPKTIINSEGEVVKLGPSFR